MPDRQGLFIIGSARSGTTILQNALNDSPDIFLFGEANFHTDPGTPDFAGRYNAMHRAWRNQETKSSFCPPILAQDGVWSDYVQRMAQHHRLVGSKTVINPVRPENWLPRLLAFHTAAFYKSHYIFTFRDPVATILSTRDLQMLLVGRTDGLAAIMRGYVETIGVFVRMYRTLPYVTGVCHEDMGRAAFDELQAWLDVELPDSHRYYDPGRVLSYSQERLDPAERTLVAPIVDLYAMLREALKTGFATPQLDQNNHHLDPGHLTVLGHICRRAELIAAALPPVAGQSDHQGTA